MKSSFTAYIVRFFSFMLALYFLNFSVDAPSFYTQSVKVCAIETDEVENLLDMVVEIDLEVQRTQSPAEDCNKELEKDPSVDSIDILHHLNQRLALLNFYHSFLVTLHKPSSKLQGRSQEITSPPPKS